MKANIVKAMAVIMTASLTLGVAPLPARMLDKAGVTMTGEAATYGTEAILSYSASPADWVSYAGQEPAKALDRNPATVWCVRRNSPSSGGLFIQFSSAQKFAPTYYTFTTAPDAASNPGRNPFGWTLYGQNSGGSWVALSSQTNSGGMQDVNATTYTFNLTNNGNQYNLYRIEFTALNSDTMALSDIRIYGNYFQQIESEKTYTVSFNTDGGSRVSSQEIRSGNKAWEPSTPTKDGYRFTGWYTSRSLSSYYDFNRKVYEDITVYAGWEAKTASNDAQLKAQQEAEAAKKAQQEAEAARIKAEQEAQAEKARKEQAEKDAAAEKARKEQAEKDAAAEKARKEQAERDAAAERARTEQAEKEAQAAKEAAAKAEADRIAAEQRAAEEEARRRAIEEEDEEIFSELFGAASEDEDNQLTASNENSSEPTEPATVTGNAGQGGAIAGLVILIIAAAGGLAVWKKKKSGTSEE